MVDLYFLKPVSIKRKVRIGPNCDGGYVLYEPALKNVDSLFSYGVGWDVNFEIDFYNRTKKKIFMYDPTMFGEKYIDISVCMRQIRQGSFSLMLKNIRRNFKWKKKIQLLDKLGIQFFNEGIATYKYSKYDTFQNQLLKNNLTSGKIILKMDIEENEYPVFQDCSFINKLNQIDQMVVEFHNLKNKLNELRRIISVLTEKFYIIHVHGNNYSPGFILYRETNDIYFPDVVEITFVDKKSVLQDDLGSWESIYPDPVLDYPNAPFSNDFSTLVFG